MFTAISMAICLLVVFVYVVYKIRQINVSGSDGYFLAGRSLTGGVICATILLTNLSTEQLVGLSGQVYSSNMGPMAWEAPACIGAIGLAFIFLPHYFRQGVMTVPEFLETRYDAGVKKLVAFLLLATYLLTFLPTVLYSGALVFEQMFNVGEILNISHFTAVALVTFILGLVGAFYTIVGGVKASASADTIYGILFAIGGCAVPIFALIFLGNGNFLDGFQALLSRVPAEKFTAINSATATAPEVPWPILFTGMVFNMLYYFGCNQSLVQRALGGKSLAEAQKGALLFGLIKVFCPLILCSTGLFAYAIFGDTIEVADMAYPMVVAEVLPAPLLGFVGAAIVGAILSSYAGTLNSCVTLYSLEFHESIFKKKLSDKGLVRVGRISGVIIAIISIGIAPFIMYAPSGLYDFLQRFFGTFNAPTLAVVLYAIYSRKVTPLAAKAAFCVHIPLYWLATLLLPQVHYLYFFAILFPFDVLVMYVITKRHPRTELIEIQEKAQVDMTPWKYGKLVAVLSILALLGMYFVFSPLCLAKI